MDSTKKDNKIQTIDAYISSFDKEIQLILQSIKKTIKSIVPDAQEAISYGMPTFKLHGNLVHFAVCKHHIGFYPTPSGIEKFKNELSMYETSKGAIKFPLNKPIPYDLIEKIVKFRVDEVSFTCKK